MHIQRPLISTIQALNHWPRFRLRLFFEGIAVGTISGSIISFFRWALEYTTHWRETIYDMLPNAGIIANLIWFLVLLLAAFLLYSISQYEPMASGSGIPQVKGVILGRIRMRWLRILWVKLIGGIVGIGLGLSLGREGPSIQIGAVTAQGLSRLLGRLRMEERYLITAGASAGLAAAFNAPLAGVMFALEELHRNFSGVVLVPAMMAALMATIVSRIAFGSASIFHFGSLPPFPMNYLWLIVVLSIINGMAGNIFNKGLLGVRSFYELPVFFHPYIKIAFALVTTGVLGYCLPQVLGGGNELINHLSEMPLSISLFGLLLVGKFLFTLISYGCGVPGGFFLPMLVIGALTGGVLGIVFIELNLIPAIYLSDIIVISMAAFFAASVQAPVTGTILIMEMTSSYDHLLVLCIASMVALVSARLCKGEPIYDSLLYRLPEFKKTNIPDNERRNVVELTVESGSSVDGKSVGSISWPVHTVLVDIKRGDKQILPDQEVHLRAGDYIYLLTDHIGAAENVRNMVEQQMYNNYKN